MDSVVLAEFADLVKAAATLSCGHWACARSSLAGHGWHGWEAPAEWRIGTLYRRMSQSGSRRINMLLLYASPRLRQLCHGNSAIRSLVLQARGQC